MSNLAELIEHLSRHEGGALGCSPVVIHTHDGEIPTGHSVDEVLAVLRGLADRKPGVPTDVITITTSGRKLRLDCVLGYHMPTGRVVITGSEVTL